MPNFTYCWIPSKKIVGPRREKTDLRGGGGANNNGADQPAHLRSLVSAIVIRLLQSTISTLSAKEISSFKLVSVAEETGLKLTLSESPEDRFSCNKAQFLPIQYP